MDKPPWKDLDQSQIDSKGKAMNYCDCLIDYYKSVRDKSRIAWQLSQISTIILAAITPVLILAGDAYRISKPLQALPGAIAAVTGSLGVFKWQENWIIGKSTQEALEAEQVAFNIGITEFYNTTEDKAIENFIIRVNALHLDQIKTWSITISKEVTSRDSNGNDD